MTKTWQFCMWISSLWFEKQHVNPVHWEHPLWKRAMCQPHWAITGRAACFYMGGTPISRQSFQMVEQETDFQAIVSDYQAPICRHSFTVAATVSQESWKVQTVPIVCITNSSTCLIQDWAVSTLVCLWAAAESRERLRCRQLSGGAPLQTEAPGDSAFHLTACVGSC